MINPFISQCNINTVHIYISLSLYIYIYTHTHTQYRLTVPWWQAGESRIKGIELYQCRFPSSVSKDKVNQQPESLFQVTSNAQQATVFLQWSLNLEKGLWLLIYFILWHWTYGRGFLTRTGLQIETMSEIDLFQSVCTVQCVGSSAQCVEAKTVDFADNVLGNKN